MLTSLSDHSLSVSFIQMLKAFNPVVILLISFAFRLQEPNQRLIGVVAVSFGSGVMVSLRGPEGPCAEYVFRAVLS